MVGGGRGRSPLGRVGRSLCDPSAIPLRSLCDPLTGSDRHQPLPTGSDRVPTASDRSRPPQTESGNEIGYRAHRYLLLLLLFLLLLVLPCVCRLLMLLLVLLLLLLLLVVA